jgi:hypothetical protein
MFHGLGESGWRDGARRAVMRICKLQRCAAPAVALLMLAACSNARECAHNLRDAQNSPDGKLKAVIVDVRCGATSARSSWVLLADANAKFRDAADKVAVFDGSAERVVWRGTALLVVYGRAKPSQTPASAKGVQIVYLEAEPAVDLGALR